MRKIIFCGWVVGLLIFAVGESAGQCTCAPVPGSRDLPAYEALRTADVVFTGEIVDVEKGAAAQEYKVKFKIRSVWKKDIGESVVLQAFRVSCGFYGEKAEEYLIYAYVREEMLTTNGCTRTQLLATADEDLKEFEEKGAKPVKVYEPKPSP